MDTEHALKSRALRLLALREHSVAEIRRKLGRGNDSQDGVEQVLSSLQSDGLLDDRRFAESYVRSRAGRGYGPLRIDGELRQRGVCSGTAQSVLSAFSEDWCEAAHRVRVKRYGPDGPRDPREQARQSRFLQYRGFSGEQIRRAMRKQGNA